MSRRKVALIVALLTTTIVCSHCSRGAWSWELPAGLPQPRVPPDNPMSAMKVELGRALFYDKILSRNGTQACASCHHCCPN